MPPDRRHRLENRTIAFDSNKDFYCRSRKRNNVDSSLRKYPPKNHQPLTNICHKTSYGVSNWKNFQKLENETASSSAVSNQNPYEQRRRLPLMRTGLLNGKRSSVSNHSKHSGRSLSGNITKTVGMDCEMVGIGERGSTSVLARVSLVNSDCECIYDKYVKPPAPVTDYRTFVSGIRPHHLENGENFFKVRKEVANILNGRILVGHALNHDLNVLFLKHPPKNTRDTTTCSKFRNEAKGGLSLKNLTLEFLNIRIQTGEHDSVEDARAAMQLYKTYRNEWENQRVGKSSSIQNVI